RQYLSSVNARWRARFLTCDGPSYDFVRTRPAEYGYPLNGPNVSRVRVARCSGWCSRFRHERKETLMANPVTPRDSVTIPPISWTGPDGENTTYTPVVNSPAFWGDS